MNKNPLKKLKKIIRKDINSIRDEYYKVVNTEAASEKQKWIIDNYYLIEKEGRQVIKSLTAAAGVKGDESGLPICYSAIFRLIGEGKMPSEDSIGKELEKYDLSVSEIELLEIMMRAAFVSRAAQGVLEDTPLFCSCIQQINAINDIDFSVFFLLLSEAEQILEKDKGYAVSTKETKSHYRNRLAILAKKARVSEKQLAEELLLKAQKSGRSVCALLEGDNRKKGGYVLAAEIIFPLIGAVLISYFTEAYYLLLPLWFVLWECFKRIIADSFLSSVTPRILPQKELNDKIPNDALTLVTVVSLLPSAENADKVKNHLKDIYLTNRDDNIRVCLLADLKGAVSEKMPEDKINIEAAKKMIDELNSQYNDAFLLFVRNRAFVATENKYFGFERKRGAVEELIRCISEKAFSNQLETQFAVAHGKINDAEKAKYIMALDSDTQLYIGSVTRLVSTAVHPMNKPIINESRGLVTAGYGVLIPKIEASVESAYKTAFSVLLAGVGGVSSYEEICSERYQDFFGSSIFTGKGLIDISAYYAVLNKRFSKERILSHDIIEGEILRCGFVCNSQVTDSFPSNEMSYFSRLNRWVRGDCQNTGFIKNHTKLFLDGRKNPFEFVSKYKIFDNLRRAATPIIAFILILISVLLPDGISGLVLWLSILSVTAEELVNFMRSVFSLRRKRFFYHYYGDALPEAVLALMRIPIKLVMLPKTAVCCGEAIIKTLYRTLISHKHMLEWVTAAEAERKDSNVAVFISSIPSMLAFFWLFILGGVTAKVISFFFLAEYLFSFLSGKPISRKRQQLDFFSREKIKSYTGAMWNYYTTYCNKDNNFLPPDNVQEVPIFRIAERTSPTNIGVMLCSVLAARDMSFISSREMYERLKMSFESIIGLKKWHGNLLNWYNTKTLEPLCPQYVSTVDSGNFLCCLTALREGIGEYKGECPQLAEIEKRIDGIISTTDLSVLYNEKRRLFHIGFDLDKNELTNSYYDLLMSEARMTSYYAVAMKQVPEKHWSALSRTMSSINGYYGLVSWSGTMFEYFMPYMFVPTYRNTLTYEALRFCVYCQKLRTRKRKLPWGISESGYYKFDAEMNYQYKAHGVHSLALKKEPFDELVISAYSTFLCLPFVKREAMRNIAELEKFSIDGECGFYEAMDFSKKRCEGQDYAVVRSYMAHHIGMSIVAADNALFDNAMQKRFMRNDNMLSCRSLLMEKISKHPISVKDVEKPIKQKSNEKEYKKEREYETVSVTNPNVNILSNGEWTTVISDCGTGHSLYRMRNITRQSEDILRQPLGVFAFVKNKNEVLSAQRATSYGGHESFRAEFDETSVTLFSKGAVFSAKTQIAVHPRIAGEIRKYTVKNRTKNSVSGKLCIYFEPSMDYHDKEMAHKAFSRIFVTGDKDSNSNIAVFRRSVEDESEDLYCACGFFGAENFICNLSREEVLERSKGIFSLDEQREIAPREKAAVDVCSYIEVDFVLAPKGQRTYDFFICAAASQEEIYSRIAQLRSHDVPDIEQCARSAFGLDDTALTVFPKLFYETENTLSVKKAKMLNTQSKAVLWQYGISGDNPIIYVETNIGQSLERVSEFVKINRKLRYCGIKTDLIIAYYESEQDKGSKTKRLEKLMKSEFSKDLINADAGVFFINLEDTPLSYKTYFVACAAFVASKAGDNFVLPSVSFNPIKIIGSKTESGENRALNGAYEISKKPPLPWSYIISNRCFGTLVSDDSVGFTFAFNSHENKLTRWNNDTVYGNNAELIFMRIGGKCYDVVKASKAFFGDEKAVFKMTAEDIEVTCEITVPQKGLRKDVKISFRNNLSKSKQIELAYYCEGVLGHDDENGKFIKAYFRGNAVELYSTQDTAYKGVMRLGVNCDSAFFCLSRKDFFEGKWDNPDNKLEYDGCAVVGKRLILPPKRKTDVKFVLSYGRLASAAQKVSQLDLARRTTENRIVIKTGNNNLDTLFNDFLLNQIIDGRLYARCGFYQCGGAYGFRDQLQDVLNIILIYPWLAKNQLVRCASAQFQKGDVLHWWHNENKKKKGIRTRYSDDFLWLPYVLCEYVKRTGDYDFLKIEVPYLKGEPLTDGENERYSEWEMSEIKGTMLEHAVKAVENSLKFGEHSLLLIGGGDWNDGFNRLGEKGMGESVWLSQFCCMVLKVMAEVLINIGESEKASKYCDIRKKLLIAIDENAFYKDRYLRAFADDGTAIGGGELCEIDSLSQSFAVFSEMPDKERRRTALESAYKKLVDKENGIVRLLTPSFSKKDKMVGYISSYPEGLRENGGQYTHAAVWLAIALLKEGKTYEGFEIIEMLNPLNKYENEAVASRYKTEPYYLCGDVYSHKGYEGRGGWSLYTGAAGWYYSLIAQELLGLKQREGRLYLKPCLPDKINGFKLEIHRDGAVTKITVSSNNKGILTVDGAESDFIPLDKNDHIVNLQ